MAASLENRLRFPLEVFDAVRAAFPADKCVSMRVSGTDWVEGGWDIEQTIDFAKALEARGCDAIHVSSGGLTPAQKIPVGPSYQVPLARAVKKAVRMPVVAVGLITEFEQAEEIVATGDADLIALARDDALRPALAVACRCTFRCACESARPVFEITTPAISRPFRHRALRWSAKFSGTSGRLSFERQINADHRILMNKAKLLSKHCLHFQ